MILSPNHVITLYYHDIKKCLLLLFQMCDIIIVRLWGEGNAFGKLITFLSTNVVQSNSWLSTIWLGSRALSPVEWSCPTFLSTVPWGMNRMTHANYYFGLDIILPETYFLDCPRRRIQIYLGYHIFEAL